MGRFFYTYKELAAETGEEPIDLFLSDLLRYLLIFAGGFLTVIAIMFAMWFTGTVPFSFIVEESHCDYIAPPDTPTTLATDYYRRNDLNERQQAVYDDIEEGLRTMADGRVLVETLSSQELTRAYYAVLNDNPDIFWVKKGFHYSVNPSGAYLIKFDYEYSPEEVKRMAEEHEQKAAELCEQFKKYASTFDSEEWCVKLAHDWVAENTSYVHSEHDQTIAGVFEDGEAVCSCYSRAMQYLCNYMGIPCIYVSGFINGDPTYAHAWNMVLADNWVWYIDSTWDDDDSDSEAVFTGSYWFSGEEEKFEKSHWTGYSQGVFDEFKAAGNNDKDGADIPLPVAKERENDEAGVHKYSFYNV